MNFHNCGDKHANEEGIQIKPNFHFEKKNIQWNHILIFIYSYLNGSRILLTIREAITFKFVLITLFLLGVIVLNKQCRNIVYDRYHTAFEKELNVL